MNYPILVGVMLIVSSTVVFVCGLYVTNGVLSKRVNRLMLMLCAAHYVWALGLAVTASAQNARIAEIGNLIAPLGWGFLSGLLLHFTLLLFQKKRLALGVRGAFLLYFPGALMVLFFSVWPALGINNDTYIQTLFGWAPVVRPDVWDVLFYVYSGLFLTVNLALLHRVKKNTKDPNERAQAALLVRGIAATYLLGFAFDVAFEYLGIVLPQIAPVFALFAVGAIGWSVYRYRPLHPHNLKESEVILTGGVREGIYTLIGALFVAGAILNYISRMIYEGALPFADASVWFLLLAAGFMLWLRRLKRNMDIKDLLVAVVCAVSIPIVILRFATYGSITVWAFTLFLLLIALLYNRRTLLVAIMLSSVATQGILWAAAPVLTVQLDSSDYLVRLAFLLIAGGLAVYVNNVYIARLRFNAIYAKKRRLLAEISQSLLLADAVTIGERIDGLLALCGNFLGCDRAFFTLFEPGTQTPTLAREWLAPDTEGKLCDYLALPEDQKQNLHRLYKAEGTLKIADIEALPPDQSDLKTALQANNIAALINLPLKDGEVLRGFLGFAGADVPKEWALLTEDFLEIIAGIVTDCVLKIEKENRIEFLAYHDVLTSLPNRLSLIEQLNEALKNRDTAATTAAALFDVDTFRSVNDVLGHDAGDALLKQTAKRFLDGTQPGDAAFRFGGDEFALVMKNLQSEDDLNTRMQNLLDTVNRPVWLYGQEVFVTLSAGVAKAGQDGDNTDSLIKNADIALHRAKEAGKNRWVICSPAMKQEVTARVELTRHLYRALEKQQFSLLYQPQIDIQANRIVGAEALLRWHLPGHGVVAPLSFIYLAEQTRLIVPIGEWVLQTACQQMTAWQKAGNAPQRIGVNVSAVQLTAPGFAGTVAEILRQTGLAPHHLELEVTESAVVKNLDGVAGVLQDLKEIGLSIAIDDFGTEYSSLNRLKVLPFDRIKMDMHFVHELETNAKDREIAKTIISLAKSMNLEVLAEGIETPGQLRFLTQFGCDEIQGFYYFAPMEPDGIANALQTALPIFLP